MHRPIRLPMRRHGDQVYLVTRRRAEADLARATKIRNSMKWVRARAWVLMNEPLCRDPFGRHAAVGETVLATEVDHIAGLAIRPDLAFAWDNLQPLCGDCHAQKTADERRAAGRILKRN